MGTTSTGSSGSSEKTSNYLGGHGWLAIEAINGQEALHNPGELGALLSIMEAARPELVLEIGTWAGGSAWAFSHITSVKEIITVDSALRPGTAQRLESLAAKTYTVTGDSTHEGTVRAVRNLLGTRSPDVVFIDGGHEYRTARKDFDTYGPMARSGGLIVLHDTQGYPGNDTVQVPRLWAEIRESYRATEVVDVPGGPGGTGIVWA
jgi:cephalosporin hydroxylase